MNSEPATNPDLEQAYNEARQRIAEAAERAGRRASDVLLVAVTKYATPDQIRALVELGQTDLAESRPQQLVQRAAQLEEFLQRKRTLGKAISDGDDTRNPADIRWHMVGHLQRNKVKHVVPLVHLTHSIDSMRLAEEIDNYSARTDRSVDVLVQVNASGEAQKQGIFPPAVSHIVEQIETMLNVRPRGLMTMAPHTDNLDEIRSTFARTAELFHEIRSSPYAGDAFNILSMGMSHDFEIAIEQGANVVRLGRTLFGENES